MILAELKDTSVDTALKNKAKESGKSLRTLRAVYDRGLAAWKSGHPKGVASGAWAMGRVNAFIAGKDEL